MKISQKSKRAAQPHPQVAGLISKLSNTSNDDVADVLATIESWKWPRSDLNCWINVLDKFDAILEDAIRDYDIDKIQLNVFTPVTKKTISAILRFERLLLENSTNRKTFNSYDRLMSLLSTSDLDVLILALNLLLRPAQQYSAQPAVSAALSISTPRLLSLSKRWPNLREHGISLLDLASPSGVPQVDVLPGEARDVSFVYYKTDYKEKEQKSEVGDEPPTTPRKPSLPPGSINVHVDEETLKRKDVMEILADILEAHPLSGDDKYELLCRMRVAKALVTGNEVIREKLLVVRLLAIAIYGHTHSENQAASTLFLYEPDLTTHIAELLQLDRGISTSVQSAAIAALDSIARYRGRIQEVLGAVNAGVNHGILMSLLRKTILDASNPESKLPNSFIDALLGFVTYLAQHAGGGNMIVGAGLVPLLVQIIENKLAQRLQMVSKAMQLVDNVLYGYANAFQLFSNARGVDVLVERIQHEIDFDITIYGDETRSRDFFGSWGELPVARAAVLKHTLRSIHRMMQSTGASEGLRGLTDSTLLQSIKKIIEYRGLFGPSVLPLAMNMMATFVHNEPTSLPTIQEAELPEVFYKAIETGVEPVIEVIQAIPNAIGALCLNQAGQDQLSARPGIIPGIFSIFTSERHLKVLRDKENAVLIGTSIDELIRHHPSLKTPVFDAITTVFSKIEELGNAFVIPEDKKEWYGLLPVQPSDETVVTMQDIESEERESESGSQAGLTSDDPDISGEDSATQRDHDNNVVMFIDVICRFLEGLFQHPQHCKDFIRNADGLDRIGKLTGLPCLPYDYANSVASDSIVQVIRTMAEIGPNEALFYLSKLVGTSLAETEEFWKAISPESKLAQMLEVTDDEVSKVNQHFRNLVVLHIRVTLMADVFSTTGYAHGRSAVGLLQTLMSDPPKVVMDMGALHRASIWENILFKAHIASKGIELGISGQVTFPSPFLNQQILASSPMVLRRNLRGRDRRLATVLPLKKETPIDKNAKALKHLTHGLPSALAPFFQSIVKLFYARRNPDPTQKKQILCASDVIAGIMMGHLKAEIIGDKLYRLDYYSVMLGLLTVLFVDERTMQNTLHTVLLLSFQRAGGLETLFDICAAFLDSIEYVTNIKSEDRTESMVQELVHAQGGLKVALHLLYPLISSKALFESGQTILVMTRDKKDTDVDYFEPHHFLVRLRLASVPVLRRIWESPWLRFAPLTLVKSVVQLVLELTAAENEELKGEAPGEGIPGVGSAIGIAAGLHMRNTGPDESRIRQLTDMGFPRSAAERALARTHNNVTAATDLLLSHPFPLPPDPDPEPEADAQQNVIGEGDEGGEGSDQPAEPASEDMDESTTRDEEMESEEVAFPAPTEMPAAPVSSEQGPSLEDLRQELNAVREPLKAGLTRQALLLVDEHPSLIFEVHKAFLRPSPDLQELSIRSLIDDIKEYSPGALDVQEEPLATRCRLLALVLSECPTLEPSIGRNLMDCLLALLLSNSSTMEPDHGTPKWLASHLLSPLFFPKEGDPIVPQDLKLGPPYPDARSIVFDFCIHLLALPSLPRDEFLATLRLLVVLSRDHNVASKFIKRDGISLIFKHLKVHGGAGSYSYIAIILRHVAEDLQTLQGTMRQEIKRFLSQPRTRIVDVSSFVRNCSAVALRNPESFIEVAQSICQLQQPYSAIHHISLKPDIAEDLAPSDQEDVKRMEMQVDSPADVPRAPSNEALESVVHFLIGELMKTYKPSDGSADSASQSIKQQPAPVVSTEQASVQTQMAHSDSPSEQERFAHCCFLMQCLSELLFSYDACKLAFLSYGPKKQRHQTPSKDGKYRTAVLQFFLSELVTYGTIAAQPDAKSRLHLCAEAKEVPPDLVSIRKFALDAISRAIKEVSLSESMDARYGRLLALTDLCNRLLTVRFSNNGSRKPPEENTTHVAKIMLEKNYVAILTNALAEADLNFPNIRNLVASVLRPLENLTRIAIKMSRASEKSKDGLEGKAQSVGSISDDEEEEDVEDAEREETPDLYRHSALGMFGGMEDVHYSQDDEMDEGDEDEEDDVDMEYGDETDSEATSNSEEVDAEEEEGDDGDESHDDGWQDEDEDYEEADLIENDEDEEADVAAVAGADQVLDEDMIWQDVGDEGDVEDENGDEGDEDDGAEHVNVIHAEQDDEPDMSDEDEFRGDVGVVDVRDVPPIGSANDDVFTYSEPFNVDGIEVHGRDVNPFMSRRRGGIDDIQVFGRSRNVPSAPSEATVHPLLLDASSGSNRTSAALSRGSRRQQRGNGSNLQNDLIHSIEDIIGGDAVQVFQHIVNRTGGGRETIRVDVAPAALAGIEQGVIQLQRLAGGPAGPRMERIPRPSENQHDSRGLDPLFTVQRWTEEAKTVNGKHVSERANRLGNHIVLAVLPATIAAKAKEEEQRRQVQLKAEEEAKQREAEEARAAETTDAQPKDDYSHDLSRTFHGASSRANTYHGLGHCRCRDGRRILVRTEGAGTSHPQERLTVTIHGSEVDITDMGIDPTFLEALPDDIREEVINQHVRDQRAARVERPADSQISLEFLDALPPEIRAELIQQERLEQTRQARPATTNDNATPGAAADIDPASFIASLDPHLRQVVLLDSDEGLLQTLPSYMIAEAGAYREEAEHPRRFTFATRGGHRAGSRPIQPRKAPAPRDAIQLLDKTGVATLVRLLFFPQVLKKNLLLKVLVNICENGKTRAELFNLLLSILQSGPGDLTAVDKSFAQMSTRTPKTPSQQTPKSHGGQKASDLHNSATLTNLQNESVPDLVAQRCLEALAYIVSANELSSVFFLTEHELPAGLRKMNTKKGKGKEKQAPQTHYPIVLLLGLLDRQSLLRTPSIMDSVVSLLSTVTKPLASLKSENEPTPAAVSASSNEPAASVSSVPPQPASPDAPRQEPSAAVGPEGDQNKNENEDPGEQADERILLASPPQIPHSVLRLIVNILTIGECSARTFQQSLTLIQNLSHIPDARDVIAQELKAKAQDCGQNVLTDLNLLWTSLQNPSQDILASSVASKFSSPSSDQTKLLRILKTLDYMYTPRSTGPLTDEARKSQDAEKVQNIYESFRFTPLWRRLGDCLATIEAQPDMEHVATVLLPLIEALMVVCKYVCPKSSAGAVARSMRASASPRSPTTARESMEDLFVTFTDAHRKILNVMVRNNPSLMSGSFSLLVHNPRVLDFDNKRNYFTQQLHRRPATREHYGTLQLNVRRARVFEDSFQYLQRKTGDQIKYGKLSVRFYDEEGVDAGGVTREWFQILARQMFDPNNALFQPCAADRLTYQPNKNSWVNPEHLSFFKFVGRVIGKAIYDGRLLDAYFAKSLYRQLLGKQVDYRDVEWVDPEYYNSLCWILENDPTPLELTFSVEADEFGRNRIFPLKPGGESIPVTQDNKREFVQLSANFRLYSSISEQIENLVAGFHEIIPKDLITIFNEKELELLISGTPDIDVDEWRAATEYNGYTSSDPVIVWWWRALKSFNREERAKVLSFATGTSRVPLNGFVDLQGVQGVQRFSIHRAYGDPDRLPQAHTCFNQIDLPQYSSYEMLRQQLLLAINEGGEGFGFA
ncbi:hypothetical protein JVU11DRAFT_2615 [Chiua virens]|nr:hypothetical protein JVU11DRAFT_2615 [Chiua virens]